MTATLFNGVVLLALVALVSGLARRLGLLRPILLLVVGIALSYVPFVLNIDLDPDLVLEGILPLLLYVAAIQISVPAFRRNRGPIGWLAFGHVLFVAGAVGFAVHALVPAIPLAAAFALGAIVGPPDAVSATAIARRIGLPRRLVTILEGESLINDATALVSLRVAVAAATGATVTWQSGSLELVGAAVGGAAIGAITGRLAAWIHRRTDDPLIDNTVSILTPFLAFLPAERLDTSGVVAVVVCGMYVGHRRPLLMGAASRLQMDAFWRVVQFLLEGVVFLLVGLQIRYIVEGLTYSTPTIVVATLVTVGVVIVGRFAWVWSGGWLKQLAIRGRGPSRSWVREQAVIGWAGMRGVVSLAAASGLPHDFPARDLIIWVTFVVIVVTLVGQGLTLPALVRWLKVPRDDPQQDLVLEAEARQAAFRAGAEQLERSTEGAEPSELVDELRRLAEARAHRAWERLGDPSREPPSETFRRLRLRMVEAERAALLEQRNSGALPDELLGPMLTELDLDELLLSRRRDAPSTGGSIANNDSCAHLLDAPVEVTARTPDGCEECLADGTAWVHLRICLTCGHVGCCDSSEWRHGTAHFEQTGHPVMRSFEPGENWRWCFVDERTG